MAKSCCCFCVLLKSCKLVVHVPSCRRLSGPFPPALKTPPYFKSRRSTTLSNLGPPEQFIFSGEEKTLLSFRRQKLFVIGKIARRILTCDEKLDEKTLGGLRWYLAFIGALVVRPNPFDHQGVTAFVLGMDWTEPRIWGENAAPDRQNLHVFVPYPGHLKAGEKKWWSKRGNSFGRDAFFQRLAASSHVKLATASLRPDFMNYLVVENSRLSAKS